jgi:hypothetical protein
MRRMIPLLLMLTVVAEARAAATTPGFARRYKVSCMLCHNPVPVLTDFGAQFAANGYRLAPGEVPADTLVTGDPLLTLAQDLGLAFRLDAYVREYTKGNAVTDFETPYALKLLSSAPISKTISYYFYAFLFERGEIGGVEDAFITFNDIGGEPADVSIGQFQVSDPLFKRELRLEYEDFAIYRARMGDSPVDLTYDRGILAAVDVLGFGITGQALNGNGRGPAQANRRFDNDFGKNFALHITRDLAPGLRVGGFGYFGRTTSESVRNETTMLGLDATLTRGILELNLQYLHRNDDGPTFETTPRGTDLDGGFAEFLVRPRGSRLHGFALYNLVNATDALLSLRLGEAGPLDRYETVTGGVGYLLRRNFRVTGEATHDIERGGVRWALGFVSAF